MSVGQIICSPCGAEIIYGATQSELKNAVQQGFMVGGFSSYVLLYVFPKWLDSILSLNLTLSYEIGLLLFVIGGCITFGGGVLFAQIEDNKHRKRSPRSYRKGITDEKPEFKYVQLNRKSMAE